MRTFILYFVLFFTLIFTACSSGSTSNKSSSKNSNNELYHGGELADDGHRLPFMPKPSENDATLLGIDANKNDIRDDVEIYIYNRFQGYVNSKVEREIAKQWAKRAQQTLISPETAYEDGKHELTERAISCEYYYYKQYLKDIPDFATRQAYRLKHEVFNAEFQDVVFSTKERLKAYFRYNKSMSGHVFKDYPNTKETCDFDPDPLIEDRP